MRISDHGLVILVHHAVAVDVHELQVAGLQACSLERICGVTIAVGCDILLKVSVVLDDSVSLVAVEVADRVADLGAVHLGGTLAQDVVLAVDDALGVGDPGDLVPVEGAVQAGAVGEFAGMLAVVDGHFHTGVAHVTAVHIRGGEAVHGGDRGVHQPVLGVLDVGVEGQAQPGVEEAGVQTEVGLLGGLPAHFRIGQDAGDGARGHRALVGEVVASARGHLDRGQVLEVGDAGVTVPAPAGAEFQEAQPVLGVRHERLVGDDPAGGEGGERAPAVAAGEVRGTVGAERRREQVLVLVAIVDTAEEGGQGALRGRRAGGRDLAQEGRLGVGQPGALEVIGEDAVPTRGG